MKNDIPKLRPAETVLTVTESQRLPYADKPPDSPGLIDSREPKRTASQGPKAPDGPLKKPSKSLLKRIIQGFGGKSSK